MLDERQRQVGTPGPVWITALGSIRCSRSIGGAGAGVRALRFGLYARLTGGGLEHHGGRRRHRILSDIISREESGRLIGTVPACLHPGADAGPGGPHQSQMAPTTQVRRRVLRP
jgi:hypothetical protein